MELKHLAGSVYYIPNVTNIGVIRVSDEAILIDTGLDEDTGKKVFQVLQKQGLSVAAVINTHSHADHIGANSYIKGKTVAPVYAPEHEAPIIEFPYLEPFFLFSGAAPIKDIKNKFLMAKPSEVDFIIPSGTPGLEVAGLKLDVVSLPGHALNQIGIAYDGVLFCADSVISVDVLIKHKIPFNVDIIKQIETLNKLKESSYELYVPSHAGPESNISSIADANMETILGIRHTLLSFLVTPQSTESLLASLCNSLNIVIKNPQQYYLLNTSVMAYLSCIHESGAIGTLIKDNRLYWEKL